MGEVVSIESLKPHMEGDALCLDCSHEWTAVAPVGTRWLECPQCDGMKGRFRYYCIPPEDSQFECLCGNDLFTITPSGVFCPMCACYANPWDGVGPAA